ncbi:MAG: hypothetical protein SPK06_06640 [Kiritimatiellia bacterium]|nr:hypothetical protein [Kiritimatiellia bacterium]
MSGLAGNAALPDAVGLLPASLEGILYLRVEIGFRLPDTQILAAQQHIDRAVSGYQHLRLDKSRLSHPLIGGRIVRERNEGKPIRSRASVLERPLVYAEPTFCRPGRAIASEIAVQLDAAPIRRSKPQNRLFAAAIPDKRALEDAHAVRRAGITLRPHGQRFLESRRFRSCGNTQT